MSYTPVQHAETVILGAGVAGLTAAHQLSSLHEGQGSGVRVLDAYPEVGGNHRSKDVGPYTFDIGSFIFWPDYPLMAAFPEVLEQCPRLTAACQRLTPSTGVRRYPFEVAEVFDRGPWAVAGAALGWSASRLKLGEPENLRDVCERALGRRLYHELGLKYYLERFYGLADEQVDPVFAQRRMQILLRGTQGGAVARRLFNYAGKRLRKLPAEPEPSLGYVRPEAGFRALYVPMRRALEARGVVFELGPRLKRVRRVAGGFVLTTDAGKLRCRRLVSTVPPSQTWQALDLPDPPRLEHRALLSLFVSFAGERGFQAPVLLNFQAGGSWKRLTMHSDAYGTRQGREYFNVEIPWPNGTRPTDLQPHFAAFAEHAQSQGVLRGSLRLEGAEVTDFAYPVYTVGVLSEFERVRRTLAEHGIESVGRQGLFDYLPTSGLVSRQVGRELAAQGPTVAEGTRRRPAAPLGGGSVEPQGAREALARTKRSV